MYRAKMSSTDGRARGAGVGGTGSFIPSWPDFAKGIEGKPTVVVWPRWQVKHVTEFCVKSTLFDPLINRTICNMRRPVCFSGFSSLSQTQLFWPVFGSLPLMTWQKVHCWPIDTAMKFITR